MAKIYSIIFLLFIFVFLPYKANAATLSISPSSGTFEVGDRVIVKVIATTTSNALFNAISGLISFPSSIFSIESTSTSSSILNFWVTKPTISASTVKFEGVTLNGFSGTSGTIVTINLRAKKAGSGKISFQSGQILANDGNGTDITGNLNGADYRVVEAAPKKVEPAPAPAVETPVVEAPQPAPTLKPPEIMLGSKYGAPAILGTSEYSKAQVLLTFVAQDGVKVFILGMADADGGFTVLVPTSLKHNIYSVTAMMIKEDKTSSDISNTIVIKVGNIFSDIGWEIWSLIGLLVLSILYLLLRIYSHFTKYNFINNSIINKNKLHEAEDTVHKSFDSLRDDINNKEHLSLEELKKDIDSTEKIIDKEIKDIES